MTISILTLFPEMFDGPFAHSIVKRAQTNKFLNLQIINIRHFGIGRHRIVDDKPFGGGVGMVMRVDVLNRAIQSVKTAVGSPQEQVVLLDARGESFSQNKAKELSKLTHLIVICGHYEGVDERVRSLVDQTISVGDFILTGGEIPAMLVTDAVTRLIPGVLKEDATTYESFSSRGSQLEYPQYTLPRTYNGLSVPEVLTNGNHKEIAVWKQVQATELTKKHRPDLLPTDNQQNE